MSGAVRGLFHRKYRIVRALNGISFNLKKGELVGYIGPNGAGKSTTVKYCRAYSFPTPAPVAYLAGVPWSERVEHVQHIGVVFGQRTQLWWDLPVVESFELLRSIYGVSPAHTKRACAQLVEQLDLGSFLDTPVRQLSLGQRMRSDPISSTQSQTSFPRRTHYCLDAVSKLAVRAFIRELNAQHGTTVILTTHDMDDIEALCTRVMVIGDGAILSDGPLEALRQNGPFRARPHYGPRARRRGRRARRPDHQAGKPARAPAL